jgi:hypothetical protein
MVAAVITNYRMSEITGSGGLSEEEVDVVMTTTGDWFLSRFGTIYNVQATGQGHDAFVTSISGNKVTITATAADHVHLRIVGV